MNSFHSDTIKNSYETMSANEFISDLGVSRKVIQMCQYLSDKIQSEKNVQKCLSMILYTQLTPQNWHLGHRHINIPSLKLQGIWVRI